MKKRQQDKKSINAHHISILTVRYSIIGSYGCYKFEAVVNDRDWLDGIDGGCIDVLRIFRLKPKHEEVFNYDWEWHAGSEDKEDEAAYEAIREYLESLPIENEDEMRKLINA